MWADTITVDLGTLRVGVRTDTAETSALVRELLDALVVPGDSLAPPNLSVRLGALDDSAVGDVGVGVAQLYRSHQLSVRSRTPHRVLLGLLRWLEALRGPSADPLQLTGLSVVADGSAVLLHPTLARSGAKLHVRLRRAGLRAIDGPLSGVHAAEGTVVVEEPDLTYDRRVLRRLADDVDSERGIEAGTFRLAGILLPHVPDVRAERVAALTTTVVNRVERGVDLCLSDLVALEAGVPMAAPDDLQPRAVVDAASQLLGIV